MTHRDQLNKEHHQQAVSFAENFADKEKQEFLEETNFRDAFEQMQLARRLKREQRVKPFALGAAALAVIFLASSIYYWQSGRYQQAKQDQEASAQYQQQRAEADRAQYIISLQNQLRENPNNGEAWYELGRAYSLSNDFESALVCFRNAHAVLGDKPAIFGAMATADYYRNKQVMTPQAGEWIEQALKLDPKESSSILLLASDAFLHNNYLLAIHYWKFVLSSENPAIDRKAIIQHIEMAEQLSKGGNINSK
ncbi:cytochrome C biogenesis protein [Glaesserella sp.]|uniref:TPR domain-containing protein n=1 Tax=Glaesserella sp. TaxID=2094731 RepID=UPI0035A05751